MDDVLVRYGKCCAPVPGDPIIGFITRGRGVTVHVQGCRKAMETDPERRVDVACPGFVSDCLETLEEIAVEIEE